MQIHVVELTTAGFRASPRPFVQAPPVRVKCNASRPQAIRYLYSPAQSVRVTTRGMAHPLPLVEVVYPEGQLDVVLRGIVEVAFGSVCGSGAPVFTVFVVNPVVVRPRSLAGCARIAALDGDWSKALVVSGGQEITNTHILDAK